MRLVLAILLCGAVPARAFLFGVPSEKKAVSMLNGMRDSFARGDCASVMDTSSGFLIEKPAAHPACHDNSGKVGGQNGLYPGPDR